MTVAPPGGNGMKLLPAKAKNESQRQAIGHQTGVRVFLFWYVPDFDKTYKKLIAKKVHFVRAPELMPYGKVAVFEDHYGNLWDLIQPVG